MSTPIPVDKLNAGLRRLGRSIDDGEIIAHGWRGDEYALHIVWAADGFAAWVGFGPEASALIESVGKPQH